MGRRMSTVLLKQRDLLTRRWRNVEALDPSELAIQIALVARLRRVRTLYLRLISAASSLSASMVLIS